MNPADACARGRGHVSRFGPSDSALAVGTMDIAQKRRIRGRIAALTLAVFFLTAAIGCGGAGDGPVAERRDTPGSDTEGSGAVGPSGAMAGGAQGSGASAMDAPADMCPEDWIAYRSGNEAHTYEPVRGEDLGVAEGVMPDRGARILEKASTRGRFPAGVSVVRVAAFVGEDGARRYLEAEPMAVDRAVYWNHVFDDLPPIREVAVLRSLGIDPRGGSASDFLRESLNVDCDLCLIYAWVLDTPEDGEFAAVLWDARGKKPLATYRATARLPESVRKACLKHEHGASRLCAAEFIAEAELRRMVRDTMWDLVAHDGPSATTQPSPWRTEEPMWPRDYEYWRIRRPSRMGLP